MDTMSSMNLSVGQVFRVDQVNTAGLRQGSTVPFMVRAQHQTLWDKMDATSCLVEGPPGSGKSTAVWYWLMQRVQRTGKPAVWCHFRKLGDLLVVVVKLGENGKLVFEEMEQEDPLRYIHYTDLEIDVCVVDGVTADNKDRAGNSWRVFGLKTSNYVNCHMIWVSSQQLVIPREHLQALNMEGLSVFSWTKKETIAFAATFSPEEKEEFTEDVISGVSEKRLTPGATVNFDQAVAIKMHYCGCSARWMFGMNMDEAIKDLDAHLSKVGDDAKLVKSGLVGSRGLTAVNHVIAMYESEDPERLGEFKIASSFIMERLSENLGMEVIRIMYSSRWVRENPSVHGFVFEWDILTRLQKLHPLSLIDTNGHDFTWRIQKSVRLADFFRHGVTADQMLVCPEKWNQPEFDGLYIFRSQNNLHLVAWNASEATTHSGSVSKLLVMLEHLSQRETMPINFATVRFVFLVPAENVGTFKMPSDSDCLLATQQLAAWSFGGFEILGATPTLP